MQLLAPAKINLHLRVGRRRDDGFHPLLSWMCTVGLFDTLTLVADADAAQSPRAQPPPAAPSGAGDDVAADEYVRLELSGDGDRPDLPRDGRNLVVRIATAFVQELRRARQAARQRGAADPPPPPRPAFRAEGVVLPPAPAPERAPAPSGAGSAAFAGAAPGVPPGTVREDPAEPTSRSVDDAAGRRTAGLGAGAVRGAEGSGRSDRRGTPRDIRDTPRESRDTPRDARDTPRAAPDTPRPAAVTVTLDKRIPVGAGLGGGSADAAYALVALDQVLGAGWAAEHLSGFAARFGSDVPFFVHAALGSPSAACRGRGEIVRPVPPPAARRALLVSPPFALSTRDVYARFDELRPGGDAPLEPAAEPDWHAWAQLPARELLARLVNDLEPAAFSLRPELADLRASLEKRLGRVVRMSGSGSSLFTLFDAADEPAARRDVQACQAMGVGATVVELAPSNPQRSRHVVVI
jgi:4-diphosphocytidyl-2C-methyl-D-erythritol kinase